MLTERLRQSACSSLAASSRHLERTTTPPYVSDYLAADGDPRHVGQRVVLQATYTGGPRYMHEKQNDAMAYVRRMGRADFVITMM